MSSRPQAEFGRGPSIPGKDADCCACATLVPSGRPELLADSHLGVRCIEPCLPTKADTLPSGGLWLHEIKHDGFRIIARKDGARVRLYSRPCNDLTERFPLIIETLKNLRCRSCIIDGEAVVCDNHGIASFDRIRYRRHDGDVEPTRMPLIHCALALARGSGCHSIGLEVRVHHTDRRCGSVAPHSAGAAGEGAGHRSPRQRDGRPVQGTCSKGGAAALVIPSRAYPPSAPMSNRTPSIGTASPGSTMTVLKGSQRPHCRLTFMGNFMIGLDVCANACTPSALSSALLMGRCRGLGFKGGTSPPLKFHNGILRR
jgi:ATP dependent DNA ligase domain